LRAKIIIFCFKKYLPKCKNHVIRGHGAAGEMGCGQVCIFHVVREKDSTTAQQAQQFVDNFP